jgi:hypothetical protein
MDLVPLGLVGLCPGGTSAEGLISSYTWQRLGLTFLEMELKDP